MSVNYAAGLSEYENKGKCGHPEIVDSDDVVKQKVEKLAELLRSCKRLVAHTGAGVSTAAGIPDFRGPKGVWTLEQKGLDPEVNVTFEEAKPTLTHLALKALEAVGLLKFVVSQNVDGLHLRSGFPRDRLAELHGNMFIEYCSHCGRELIRYTAVPTIGQRFTGNVCQASKKTGAGCRGRMKDSVLDWEHSLPDLELWQSEQQASRADVNLCLGTSLQILPAANLPLLNKKKGGKLVIVNLQPTKHDKKADLIIHSKVDEVMQKLLGALDMKLPSFESPEVVLQSAHGPPSTGQSRSKPPTCRQLPALVSEQYNSLAPLKSEPNQYMK